MGFESGSGQNKITCKGQKKWERKIIEVAYPSVFVLVLTGSMGSFWGMKVFSVRREHGIGILVVVLHYIAYFARFSVEP